MDNLMVIMMATLWVYCLETHWDSSARIIRRVDVTDVTAASRAGFTWFGSTCRGRGVDV